ncbi:MAG: hypothetical protein RL463_379 [Bacteroidota bacterium]|jgi:hypothetical protein
MNPETIDGLKERNLWLESQIAKEKSQNKKLREALEKIDNSNDDMKYFNSDIDKIISETREALKEVGEK